MTATVAAWSWICVAAGVGHHRRAHRHGPLHAERGRRSERLVKGKADAPVVTLETDLAELRVRSEYQTRTIAHLDDEVAFLRSVLKSVQAAA